MAVPQLARVDLAGPVLPVLTGLDQGGIGLSRLGLRGSPLSRLGLVGRWFGTVR
ncbi:hypothetical protein [Streptomyces sp. AC495_CC817]|uniref:hypothetical protein n=1 Tax=Streptomyces sp. AC495_CC817 TaxID=2823900 RepID=UPI001C274326|nr:hypothetical protein [Streptomyces sp. AC495_CC817]